MASLMTVTALTSKGASSNLRVSDIDVSAAFEPVWTPGADVSVLELQRFGTALIPIHGVLTKMPMELMFDHRTLGLY